MNSSASLGAASGLDRDRPEPAGRRLGLKLLALVLPVFFTAWFASFVPAIAQGEIVRLSYAWVPSLGVNLSFLLDGLSLTFALLISGIGVIVTLYSATYLSGHAQLGRFFLFLVSFMLSMLGLVLADNLITLFVFWELTTITSYLLIGFDHASAKARRCALQALLITGAGGLALLAGIILMGVASGSFELTVILAQAGTLQQHGLYLPILILVLCGAFTKSAQFPFHFWLPNAMAAPTPVSAYLHSATMVKAGIYLLARLHPALGGTPEWIWTLTLFGAVTAVVASVLAIRQTDLKLALAYTTVMALGTLTMFLGAEATVAIAAAMTFLVVHSLYKAALFLVVGNIDHGTGTRDANILRGLAKAMPITACAAAAAAFSMAGFPPFLGFIGKELKYEGALAIASEPVFVASAAVTANALMVAVAGIVALRPFFGPTAQTPKMPHEAPLSMWIGPALLAALGLLFGLVPWLIADSIIQPAVSAILGRPETVKLALWHGINIPLLMSILTVALGLAIYFSHGRLRNGLIALGERSPISGDRAYDVAIDGLKWIAAVQTKLLQNGRLKIYLLVVFVTLCLLIGGTFIARGVAIGPVAWPDLRLIEWATLAFVLGGTLLTLFTQSRLTAICALGVVGIGVALVFLLFGAPDLAITQLLVETLIVVLAAVVMLRLPRSPRFTDRSSLAKLTSVVVAVAAGGLVTAVLLGVTSQPFNYALTAFFEEQSVPAAFGRNIVNVILVDFRALDTFGEIAVVAVAGLAAFALIASRQTKRGEKGGSS